MAEVPQHLEGPDARTRKTVLARNSDQGTSTKPMINSSQVKGFVWYDEANVIVYYHNGTDVFGAWEGNAVDIHTGYLIGRWECSISHWNTYAEVYKRPLIKV